MEEINETKPQSDNMIGPANDWGHRIERKLPYVVRRGHKVVARFATLEDASDFAALQSVYHTIKFEAE